MHRLEGTKGLEHDVTGILDRDGAVEIQKEMDRAVSRYRSHVRLLSPPIRLGSIV